MRKIYKIAITELCTLFYSPVAWLILVIFAVQAAMVYTDTINIILGQQFSRPLWYSIVKELFTRDNIGMFSKMLGNLYLYIPLLTMGLMSREYSSGSIKLLYSSPVSTVQIVLGKFLSMMIYNSFFAGILLVFVFVTAFNVPNFDYTLALSGVLGLYLVVCAYAAIGLFMSCLTSYQVVAAVSTLAVLAFLNYVGGLGQDIPFVRDITYWLSIQGRSAQMIGGLICSEDILYFIIVIGLFLSFSVIKIQSGKKRRSRAGIITQYAVVTVFALLLGYASSRPVFKLYYDASVIKFNTLSKESREVMDKMDGGLTITTYVNLMESHYHNGIPSSMNSDKDRFKEYIRFKPRIKMKYVYYYKDVKDEYIDERFSKLNERQKAERVAIANDLDIDMFLSPDEISKQIDLSGENYRFVRVVERENGKKTFLRVYDDGYVFPNEAEISTVMKRLITDVPKVAFVAGHGERDTRKAGDRDYYTFAKSPTFRHSLINKGFDSEVLDLSKVEDVPADVNILIVADPYTAFSAGEIAKVNRYIARGGNLVIAGEPGKQDLMNAISSSLGVRFVPGELVQPTGVYNDNMLICGFVEDGVKVMTSYRGLLNRYGIVMPGATTLSYDTTRGFQVVPVLATASVGSWNELEKGEKAEFNPLAGEVQGSYPTMLALTRQYGEREQRIVVLGDADCISNSELLMDRAGARTANFSLITGMFRWLSYGEFPMTITPTPPQDTVLELTIEGMPLTSLLLTWIFPALFVLGGVAVWMKRRLG